MTRAGRLAEGHPALNASSHSIHHGGELVAMLALPTAGGYDQALVDFMHPLLITLASWSRRHVSSKGTAKGR